MQILVQDRESHSVLHLHPLPVGMAPALAAAVKKQSCSGLRHGEEFSGLDPGVSAGLRDDGITFLSSSGLQARPAPDFTRACFTVPRSPGSDTGSIDSALLEDARANRATMSQDARSQSSDATAMGNAQKAGDVRHQEFDFTLRLTGSPIYPNTGRAGRKAAHARLAAVVTPGVVKKAIPANGGRVIRGTLYDAELVPGFLRLVASIGLAEIKSQHLYPQQVSIQCQVKRHCDHVAQLLPLGTEQGVSTVLRW